MGEVSTNMRPEGKQPPIRPTPAVDRTVEDERYYIERYVDGTVNVTVEAGGKLIGHGGTPAAVRTRLVVDAEPRDRAAVDAAVRDIVTAQAAPEGSSR